MVGWHHDSRDMSLNKLWEIVEDRKDWHTAVHGSQRVGHNLVNEQQKKQKIQCFNNLHLLCRAVISVKHYEARSFTMCHQHPITITWYLTLPSIWASSNFCFK